VTPWLLLAVGLATAAPSDATVVYYNARLALREDAALEAVKLWLLRNSLESETGRVSPHDADFGSVTWAALGELGLCTDGHRKDLEGAGLWPLGMHNHVVRNMGRRSSNRLPRTFDAFDVGRQQREVAIGDVLDAEMLRTVRLKRGRCFGPRIALAKARQNPLASFSDRKVTAHLLRDLLERSRESLAAERVRGQSVIEARLFDLDLQLTALAEREARRKARARAQRGRILGLSRGSTEALLDDAPTTTLDRNSEAARILRASASWPISEWMALEPERRRFLFDHARDYGVDEGDLDRVALGVLDTLIARGEGAEAQAWVGRAAPDLERQARLWQGARGAALLALDPAAGFDERAPVALQRGVYDLSQGEMERALRAFAYALAHATDSSEQELVANLSRRWLTYVAGRFEMDAELLATLRVLVPGRDFSILLEDLMWRAAFHADAASFAMGEAAHPGRGALDRRLAALRPLARGDAPTFAREIERGLKTSPSETLRLLEQLVQRLEREELSVRVRHQDLLAALRLRLAPMSEDRNGSARRMRTATTLRDRMQGILEGVGVQPVGAQERSRGLDPRAEVFVGSVRLAPVDPLPWPFRTTAASPPSVFTQIDLRPVEWRDADGQIVFGWSIEG
jgi:hypothetical protein